MEIFPYGAIEEKSILGDIPYSRTQRFFRNGVKFGIVDGNGARVIFIETTQEIDDSGFSSTCSAD